MPVEHAGGAHVSQDVPCRYRPLRHGHALDELARRRAAAEAMGGEEALARHRASGRFPVRERVTRLSTRTLVRDRRAGLPEIRREKPVPGDAVVTGFGRSTAGGSA